MIVLNYHRVEDDGSPDFYTISPGEFSSHLNTIRALNLRVASSDEILSMEHCKGVVMLHFDDGTKGHFENVAPQLEDAGMKGVFFVPTEKVGGDRYLSIQQVQTLAAKGHSIECHGHTHRRLDDLTEEELEIELATSVSLIAEWTGRRPLILAPPGGYFNDAVICAAKRHGMNVTRTMSWNCNRMPIRDRLDCLVVTRSTTCKQVGQWVLGHGILRMRIAYKIKQAVRSILPFGIYLKFREILSARA